MKVPRPLRLDRLDRLPEHMQQVALGLWCNVVLLPPIERLLKIAEAREHYQAFASITGLLPEDPTYPEFGAVVTAVCEFIGNDIEDLPTACLYVLSDDPEWTADARRWANQVGLGEELEHFVAFPLQTARTLAQALEVIGVEKTTSTIH